MIKVKFKKKDYDVTLEGEDIVAIMDQFIEIEKELAETKSFYKEKEHETNAPSTRKKDTVADRILTLEEGTFFRHPRAIMEIKNKMAESGHHYPVTSLSPYLLEFVKKGKLRRFKEKKDNKVVWVYVRK